MGLSPRPGSLAAALLACVWDWTEVSLSPHLSSRSTPPQGVYGEAGSLVPSVCDLGSHRALSCALPCCLCVDGNAGNVLCLPDIPLSKSIGEKFPSPSIRRRAGFGNLCFEIFFQNYDESKICFSGHIMLFTSSRLFVFCLWLWMYQATYPKKALRKVPLTFNPQKIAFWQPVFDLY